MEDNIFDWLGLSKYIEYVFDTYYNIIDTIYDNIYNLDNHIISLK